MIRTASGTVLNLPGAPQGAGGGGIAKRIRRGMHRIVEPETTLARVRPYLLAMGITRIANVTGLDELGVPVVMVCRPNSRSLAMAQGKGLDLPAAKASGVMESVETWHAERITSPLKLNTYEELRYTHRVVDVETLPCINGSRFHQNCRLLWIEGYDLLQEESVWLPYELVHTNYTLPLPSGSGCFPMTSSGLASGNHKLEAISHALCELVERDAITLWKLRSEAERRATRIDTATIDDRDCTRLLERLDSASVAAAIWDITSDTGVPAFLCQIINLDGTVRSNLGWASGTGAHPTREIALLRAIMEAAQCRLIQITGSRDDFGRRHYRPMSTAELSLRRDRIIGDCGSRGFGRVPTFDFDTLEEDVAWLVDRMEPIGLDRIIVVDLTRREFGIPVVRAVVPGLEDGVDTPNYLPGPRARAVWKGEL